MQDFRQLKVWEKAHGFTLAVYGATSSFPRTETYALTSQLRRSASSTPSNIAEGCGRGSNADLVRFLHIALGSASEADYQLQLALELGYLGGTEHAALNAQVDEVKKMLAALIKKIERGEPTKSRAANGRLTTYN